MLSSLLNSSRSCSHLHSNDIVVSVLFLPLLPVDAQQEGGVAAGLHGPGQLDTVQFSSPRSVEWSTWARYCDACFGLNLSGPSKAAPAHLDRTVFLRTQASVCTLHGQPVLYGLDPLDEDLPDQRGGLGEEEVGQVVRLSVPQHHVGQLGVLPRISTLWLYIQNKTAPPPSGRVFCCPL